jgi:drug/metabolite transporter (DMT)-like permease
MGVISATVGVWLIERAGVSAQAWPVTIALASAMATAIAMLGLHQLRGVDSRAIVAHFAGVAFVVSSVVLVWARVPVGSAFRDPQTLGVLLGVAATGTLGQLCLTRAYATGNPARLATIGLTQVVFALAIDVVFWGRSLTVGSFTGFLMVLAPSALLSGLAARGARRISARVNRQS